MKYLKTEKDLKSFLLKGFKEMDREMGARIKEIETRLNRERNIYLGLVVQLDELKKTSKTVEKLKRNKETWIKNQIETISNHSKVIDCGIKNKKFWFRTKNITITHPRNREIYDIGCFEVTIGILGKNQTANQILRGIKLKNITRKVDAFDDQMNHPHVWNDGRACFGNAEPTIFDLIGCMEYAGLVSYLISFLESANINDSAGAGLTYWPKVQKNDKR
jgi:hypothetical protein